MAELTGACSMHSPNGLASGRRGVQRRRALGRRGRTSASDAWYLTIAKGAVTVAARAASPTASCAATPPRSTPYSAARRT